MWPCASSTGTDHFISFRFRAIPSFFFVLQNIPLRSVDSTANKTAWSRNKDGHLRNSGGRSAQADCLRDTAAAQPTFLTSELHTKALSRRQRAIAKWRPSVSVAARLLPAAFHSRTPLQPKAPRGHLKLRGVGVRRRVIRHSLSVRSAVSDVYEYGPVTATAAAVRRRDPAIAS